ncbi:hypothetical protein H109_07531 [Trichophyton interdigitale MR816]|uniref:Uncharacterized protein n=1 Tax=Trichophyton interdigitale (strain MR816) TaxID=1215338 RepID=A0A059IY20_TRIIM|nr:hypothetical protein H101_01847 [Trichophyton interdigitale H6]KDB20526.1 hypothetical protein H109_07531 [Trichophyton interdigitale MR816]
MPHSRTNVFRRAISSICCTRILRKGDKPEGTQTGKEMALLASIEDGTFATLNDIQAVQLFGTTFYWELDRLKRAKPTVETSGTKTLGNLDGDGLTPSQLLFGEDFVEVNRTLVGMLALKWLWSNDYDSFTRHQNQERRLQPESFERLYTILSGGLPHPYEIYALLVAIAVNDLGKDDSLQTSVAKITGQTYDNHDEVLLAAANAQMIPSINTLQPDLRSDLILGLEVGSSANLAQLAQAENVPASLESIYAMRDRERAFFLKYMEVLLDIAGAAGHIDSRSAGVMVEPVFRSYLAVYDALVGAISGILSLNQAYDHVLTCRARILEESGFRRISTRVPEERALLRLLTMGRVADISLAGCFSEAFANLTENIRKDLVAGLGADGLNMKPAILPYYAPGLIAEALRSCAGSSENQKIHVVGALMRFLARVYRETASKAPEHPKRETPKVIEVDLSFAQQVVSGENFRLDPSVLDAVPIPRLHRHE